jgi:hypothetical protein
MSYITLNNTNMVGPQGVRKTVAVRKLGTTQYGFKMYINDEYLGIQWTPFDEKKIVAEAKNFLFSKASNCDLVFSLKINCE